MKIITSRNVSESTVKPVWAVLLSCWWCFLLMGRGILNKKKANIAYCCWLPIMIHNPLAALKYYTNMSGLWFGHNLHGYNNLSTDSRLSGARWLHCNDWPRASDSLFQAPLAQSPGPPFSSIPNLDPDSCLPTNTAPRRLHLSTPPPDIYLLFSLKSSVLFYKLFLYHTSISHGDQYRCNSLDFPKSARLRAFAHITAIDSFSFGRSPMYFDIFYPQPEADITFVELT